MAKLCWKCVNEALEDAHRAGWFEATRADISAALVSTSRKIHSHKARRHGVANKWLVRQLQAITAEAELRKKAELEDLIPQFEALFRAVEG